MIRVPVNPAALRSAVSPAALRGVRIQRALSVRELAVRADVPPSVIYRLEAGTTRYPVMASLRRLAGALGVEVVDLVERDVA